MHQGWDYACHPGAHPCCPGWAQRLWHRGNFRWNTWIQGGTLSLCREMGCLFPPHSDQLPQRKKPQSIFLIEKYISKWRLVEQIHFRFDFFWGSQQTFLPHFSGSIQNVFKIYVFSSTFSDQSHGNWVEIWKFERVKENPHILEARENIQTATSFIVQHRALKTIIRTCLFFQPKRTWRHKQKRVRCMPFFWKKYVVNVSMWHGWLPSCTPLHFFMKQLKTRNWFKKGAWFMYASGCLYHSCTINPPFGKPSFWETVLCPPRRMACPHKDLSPTLDPLTCLLAVFKKSCACWLKKTISCVEKMCICLSGFWLQIWEDFVFPDFFCSLSLSIFFWKCNLSPTNLDLPGECLLTLYQLACLETVSGGSMYLHVHPDVWLFW